MQSLTLSAVPDSLPALLTLAWGGSPCHGRSTGFVVTERVRECPPRRPPSRDPGRAPKAGRFLEPHPPGATCWLCADRADVEAGRG